jgi:myo-inositol-1(or 4)-monophosphatase
MTNAVAPELHEIEQLATEIAGRAGDMLRDRFRSAIEVRFKDQRGLDPVTDADHAVEAMVRAAVHARFPTHALLGEEGDDSGPPDADYVWVVDPLDGTANFVNGLPLFSCSIGVVHRGEPVVGAIWASTGRRLQPGVYHAARGGGLRFDGVPVPYAPLEVDQPNRLSALPGGVIGVTGPRGRRFGIARTLGSIALELALTADGSFRYCVIGDGKIWDVAAGVALCLAAGVQISAKPVEGGWRSLERFIPGETAPSVATLRDWREKIVVGDPAVVPEMARDLAREQGRLGSLRRLFFGSES